MAQLTLKRLTPRLSGWFARTQDNAPTPPLTPPATQAVTPEERLPQHLLDHLQLTPPATQAVTPEAIRWAYRLFLDREPESEQIVRKHERDFRTTALLRYRMLRCAEYRTHNLPIHVPSLTGNEPPLVIEDVRDTAEMTRILDHIGQTWQKLGEIEPHWSVITSERFHASNIKETEAEFYNSGEEPVTRLFKTLERAGVDPSRLRTCLEYGCGLGRVTGWLTRRFERVYGYDISAAHLEAAKNQLTARGITNVTLRQIRTVADIQALERVDLVYCLIVLQHNPPPVIRLILREFLRAVKPGGVLFFQVPTYREGYQFTTESYLANEANTHVMMEMHVLPQRDIFRIVREEGGEVLEVIEDGWTGLRHGEVSNSILIGKPA